MAGRQGERCRVTEFCIEPRGRAVAILAGSTEPTGSMDGILSRLIFVQMACHTGVGQSRIDAVFVTV